MQPDSRPSSAAQGQHALEDAKLIGHYQDAIDALPSPGEQPGVPEDFDVRETLRAADEAASIAHDFIHGLNGVTREQASEAVWTIHNNLRPLFEEADLGY